MSNLITAEILHAAKNAANEQMLPSAFDLRPSWVELSAFSRRFYSIMADILNQQLGLDQPAQLPAPRSQANTWPGVVLQSLHNDVFGIDSLRGGRA